MNVVLSIEAIHPPLAGVGRYAWELATRLPMQSEINSVRFLSDGFWSALPSLDLGSNQQNSRSGSSLRQRLGSSQLVSYAYGKLVPWLAKRSLSKCTDSIFHGPNYLLPDTSMRSLVTVHDLSVFRFPQWHPATRVRRAMKVIPESVRRASMILTDSLATKQEIMQEFSLRTDQVHAVPLGVDSIFRPRTKEELIPLLKQFGLQPDGYSFFVSTIEPRKNLTNLLAAYANLPVKIRSRWPLVLVGAPGWQSEEIHKDIDRAQREGWLKYLGFVDQNILPALYAGCRLFTYPSWYEGFGLPIAEAMASGVPVLTSNCSSMPEVADGAAMLVEPGDVASICKGILQALEDKDWRSIAIESGKIRASALTWDACIGNTVMAYNVVKNR